MAAAKKPVARSTPSSSPAKGKGARNATRKRASGKAAAKAPKKPKAAKQWPIALYVPPPPPPPPTRAQRFRAWAEQADDAAISELVQHVVTGGDLAGFCQMKDFAYVTVYDWIRRDSRRAGLYDTAREDRADYLADEIRAIADEDCSAPMVNKKGEVIGYAVDTGAVQRNRLRVDARKWAAAKMKPRVYGEKVDIDLKQRIEDVSDDALIEKLRSYGIDPERLGPAPMPMGMQAPTGEKVH